MGILSRMGKSFSRILGLSKLDEDPSPTGSLVSDWGYINNRGEIVVPSAPRVLLSAFRSSLWVYKCVSAKARALGGAPRLLKRAKKGAADDVVGDDAVLEILEDPYPDAALTYPLLMETIGTHLDLTGNAYLEKLRNADGGIAGLAPLMPDKMEKIIPKEGPATFIYRPFGYPEYFDAKDIVHFRYLDPCVEGRGMSPMVPGWLASSTDLAASQWNERYFRAGAQPDGVLMTDKAVPPKERKRIKDEWNAKYQGVKNGRKIAVLPYGLKYEETGTSHREMQFEKLKRMTREEIHAIFHVPPVLSGLMDQASYATASVQLKIFRELTLVPLLRYIFAVFKNDVIAEMDETGELYLDVDESKMKTSEEVKDERAGAKDLFLAGLITRGEARSMIGFTEDSEELDELEEQGIDTAQLDTETPAEGATDVISPTVPKGDKPKLAPGSTGEMPPAGEGGAGPVTSGSAKRFRESRKAQRGRRGPGRDVKRSAG